MSCRRLSGPTTNLRAKAHRTLSQLYLTKQHCSRCPLFGLHQPLNGLLGHLSIYLSVYLSFPLSRSLSRSLALFPSIYQIYTQKCITHMYCVCMYITVYLFLSVSIPLSQNLRNPLIREIPQLKVSELGSRQLATRGTGVGSVPEDAGCAGGASLGIRPSRRASGSAQAPEGRCLLGTRGLQGFKSHSVTVVLRLPQVSKDLPTHKAAADGHWHEMSMICPYFGVGPYMHSPCKYLDHFDRTAHTGP